MESNSSLKLIQRFSSIPPSIPNYKILKSILITLKKIWIRIDSIELFGTKCNQCEALLNPEYFQKGVVEMEYKF